MLDPTGLNDCFRVKTRTCICVSLCVCVGGWQRVASGTHINVNVSISVCSGGIGKKERVEVRLRCGPFALVQGAVTV